MNRRLRSPSAMVLMEFCLSFLIFCLCVAVIVQVLAQGLLLAQRSQDSTRACLAAQSLAEAFKASGGTAQDAEACWGAPQQDGLYRVYYDAGWNPSDAGSAPYCAQISLEQHSGLATLKITVTGRDGELFRLNASEYFDIRRGDGP